MAFFLRIVGADFTLQLQISVALIHEKAEWGRKKNGAGKVWRKYHTDESDHTRAAFKLEVCALYSSFNLSQFHHAETEPANVTQAIMAR